MTLYQQQSSNIRKTWFLVTVFLIVTIGFGWFLSYYFGDPGILYIAVAFALVMNLVSYWSSHKIAIAVSGAKKADEVQYRALHTMLENLCISQGMKKPELYIIQDSAPNAFASGRNEKNAVVAVTTGLLSVLDPNEIEGVLAHELAHIKNKDILLASMVVVLVGFIAIISDILIRSMIFGRGGGDRDNRLGLILAIVGIVLAILSPIIAKLIQLAISRKREYMADASAALMTRYPEGLASALQKIENHYSSGKSSFKKGTKAMEHMYIANPFLGRKKSSLWSTHPPTEKRVKALLSGQVGL